MYRIVLFYFCIGGLAMGCQNSATTDKGGLGLNIRLSADKSAVLVEPLPPELVSSLSDTDTLLWKQFLKVYPEPEDPDLRDFQKPMTGKYLLAGNSLRFKPDVPFKKGQAYFAQVQTKDLGLNLMGLFQKKGWQQKQKPQEFRFSY